MTHHEDSHPGPTPPRGWRPRPLYVVAAAFAIVLLVVWLWMLAAGPSTSVEPLPRAPDHPLAPAAR